MTPLKTLIIEDHPLLRSGLRLLIAQLPELTVVGETGTKTEAISLWRQHSPDLVVLDLHLADGSGIELIRSVPSPEHTAKILVISSDATPSTINAVLKAGVQGYFLKTEPVSELTTAIRTIIAGKMFLSPSVVPIVLGRRLDTQADPGLEVLSPREREVLRYLALGLRTKEVAAELDISVKTAETFRRRLIKKLQISSIAELTRYAIRQGVLPP